MKELKTNHDQNTNTLDAEAIETIKLIIQENKDNGELTDYIPSLEKDWFKIEWTPYNRQKKVTDHHPAYKGNQAASTHHQPLNTGTYQQAGANGLYPVAHTTNAVH